MCECVPGHASVLIRHIPEDEEKATQHTIFSSTLESLVQTYRTWLDSPNTRYPYEYRTLEGWVVSIQDTDPVTFYFYERTNYRILYAEELCFVAQIVGYDSLHVHPLPIVATRLMLLNDRLP